MKRLFIFVVSCCLAFHSTLSAQEKVKIVIETSIGDPEVERLFTPALQNGLTRSGRYTVLTNRDEYMLKLGGELRAQDSGMIDDRQMLELGRAAGADEVIYANIVSFDGGEYAIYVQRTELKSGTSLMVPEPYLTTRAKLMLAAIQLAKDIAEGGLDGTKESIGREDIAISNVLMDGGIAVNGHIDHKDRAIATWAEAVSACEEKGEGWRLPTIDELEKIYRGRHSIGSSLGFQRFQPTVFWSSSQRNAYSMYGLDFSDGSMTYVSKTTQSSYRCVRSM